jgi:uncharacterized protein (TIGR02271 family)
MPRITVPVTQEHLVVGRKRSDKGVVRVRKTVERRTQAVDVPLSHEEVDVERVRIDRVCEAPTPARQEGDVLVVPVFEEVVTVQRQWVLKEEIRLRRRTVKTRHREEVVLRGEQARIEREPARRRR